MLRRAIYDALDREKQRTAENVAIQDADKNKDFNRLNELAAARIVRGEVPAGVAFNTGFYCCRLLGCFNLKWDRIGTRQKAEVTPIS